MYYLLTGERLERTVPWFERVGGLDHLTSVLIDDSLGICAELEAQMDSGADVIAHGILGTRDGRPVVASPMHKQEFDLRTGRCRDDPSVTLPVHEA
ncbi:nitrite reductase (NAD(P)H) small subunit [Streptomyces sp. NPDC058308]|uniref:nitrite reductase (NAD(P)H) small subunit n=1 Tax=Streptomyces sp. NPDC058308 TaxID=3346440 RepID=UPI0036F1770A